MNAGFGLGLLMERDVGQSGAAAARVKMTKRIVFLMN
jgi:hypothetical protein